MFSVETIEENLAKIDMGRDIRKRTPEVILSEGKSQGRNCIVLPHLKKDVVLISRIQEHHFLKYLLPSKGRDQDRSGEKEPTMLVNQEFFIQANDSKSKIGIRQQYG
jgi:NCAIR mutase (PurE)-related protein